MRVAALLLQENEKEKQKRVRRALTTQRSREQRKDAGALHKWSQRGDQGQTTKKKKKKKRKSASCCEHHRELPTHTQAKQSNAYCSACWYLVSCSSSLTTAHSWSFWCLIEKQEEETAVVTWTSREIGNMNILKFSGRRREGLLRRPPTKHNASANHKRMPSVDPVGALDALIYSMANQLDITKLSYTEFESKSVLADSSEKEGEVLQSEEHAPCISVEGIFECKKCNLDRDSLVITWRKENYD